MAKLGKKPVFARGVKNSIPDVPGKGSSDEDNVSWLSPLGCFTVACASQKTKGHNRELTAQTNLPFAHRGIVCAAEVLAGTAWDLLTKPRLLMGLNMTGPPPSHPKVLR